MSYMSATCLTPNKFFSWTAPEILLITHKISDDGGWSPKQAERIKKLYLDVYCKWKLWLKKKYNMTARYE
jgi:hypothetical protein